MGFRASDETYYRVDIATDGVWISDPVALIPSAQPVTTEEVGDEDLFMPVRTQSGYLRIVDTSDEWKNIMPLSATARRVYVYRGTGAGTLVWKGYLKPETYSGEYLRGQQERELPICCPLSVLDSWDVAPDSTATTKTFAGVLHYIFRHLGEEPATSIDGYYFVFQGAQATSWLSKRVTWANFEEGDDDDDERTAKYSCLELLEHVCRFLGWMCRINGKDIYFVSPDDSLGITNRGSSFLTLTLDGLASIEAGSLVLPLEDRWYFPSLTGELFASRRNTENYLQGIRKATVTANINKIDTLMDVPFGLIGKTFNGINPGSIVYGENRTFFYRYAGVHYSRKFGSVIITTNRGNLDTNQTTEENYRGGMLLDYEWYEGDFFYKANWCRECDLYLIGQTMTSSGGEPVPIGQPVLQIETTPLATIRTVRSFSLSDGVLVISATVHSDYEDATEHHKRDMSSGTLKMRVSVGNYYASAGNFVPIGSGSADAYWFDAQVGEGNLATNRRINNSWPYPAFEGHGLPIGQYVVSGPIKIEFAGFMPKDRPATDTSMIPEGTYKRYAGVANIHITDLKVTFLRRNGSNAHDERSTNKYTAAGASNFADETSVSTIFASDNQNSMGDGLVMNEDGSLLSTLTFGSVTAHPEQHLANRMADYGSGIRRVFELELRDSLLRNIISSGVSPQCKVIEYGGVSTYPVAVSHDFRDDRVRLKLMELGTSSHHYPPAGEWFYITTDLDHVSVDGELPDRVRIAGILEIQLVADTGYAISSVIVTMGGEDVVDAWDAETGTVFVGVVMGDIEITAVAEVPEPGPEPEPPYDAQVEYLQSDGTAYIDTGITGASDITIEADIEVLSTFTGQSCAIFGSRIANNNAAIALQYYKTSNSSTRYWRWAFGNDAQTTNHGGASGDFHLSNVDAARTMVVTGAHSSTTTCSAATFDNDLNIFLFGFNSGGTLGGVGGIAYVPIKGFKIYSGGTLVRDYIPVRKDGVGYLYDQVTETLFGNAAESGAFSYGSDVEESEE